MVNDFLKDDKFHFFVPDITIAKAESGNKEDDSKRYLQGVASTSGRDLEGEVMVQSGLDYSYFIKRGYINDNHGPVKVGEPVECRITPAGFWIKAFLYQGKGMDRAEYWWNFINALESNKSSRKIGWSVEGKVTRREGKSILAAFITNVAITDSPINTATFAEVSKALSEERHCIHPWKSLEKACKGCPGQAACGETLCKDELEVKGLSTVTGHALIPQDLDGTKHTQTYKSLDKISYEDAIKHLQLERGYSRNTAKALADAIFSSKGMR